MGLRLDLFGPVRAWRDDEQVALGAAARRALLTVLALQANQVVARSELIDALWGTSPPASANGSIYTYVSALRAALEPERTQRSANEILASSGAGYRLHWDPEAIDVVRFENLREDARRLERDHDHAGALDALEEALGLYRSAPLEGLPGPFAARQRERLTELRLDTVERRARLKLELGRHTEVVAELTEPAHEHPTRESLQSLMLLALHRSGRSAEALELFAGLREATIEQLGTEPGPEVTKRHEQIKNDDPALWHSILSAPRRAKPAPARPDQPSWLEAPSLFLGRDEELRAISSALADLAKGRGGSLRFEGEPGIGKSALIAAGLAGATACRVGVAVPDDLLPDTPLQTILECLSITEKSAIPAAREITAAARRLVRHDRQAVRAVIEATVALVSELCRKRPMVLVVDGLQWADPESFSAWQRFERETARLPLLLIGTCRPWPKRSEIGRSCGVRDGDRAKVYRLNPLTDCDVRELMTGLLGRTPEPAEVELGRAAAGNPQYLHDIVAARADEKSLDQHEIPAAALTAVSRRLSLLLSRPAMEGARWAALLHEPFRRKTLAAALRKGVSETGELVDELCACGVLSGVGDDLTFRHPVVRQAFYAKTSPAIRLALQRQLAETLADAGVPVELVARQLLAAPIPVDVWFRDWLITKICALTPRAPSSAARLLRRAGASGLFDGADREMLTIALARLMFWQHGDLTPDSVYATAKIADGDVAAELRWFHAYSAFSQGSLTAAIERIEEALRDPRISPAWRTLHEALLSRTRLGRLTRISPIPPQRGTDESDEAEAYLRGHWDEPADELVETFASGTAMASRTLGRPNRMRQLSGIAALIAARRDHPEDADAHLHSVWSTAPEGEIGSDGSDFMIVAAAMLAEQQSRQGDALALVAGMTEPVGGAFCRWMPMVARLAAELGEHDQVKLATLTCERTPGNDTALLRCRAILDDDPGPALTAAALSRADGSRLGLAEAMEDAAWLYAKNGKNVEATVALRAALRGYGEIGATWDIRRARQRLRPFLGRYPDA
ncbi:BTAD domain-containing putative transcriptional regulator [Amycolatopsis pigmentata]|uniref:BTAD domain-containing putative transcriptional regulator n=1 Tax=Amycolatopsis pigmentata TaxID=450801 RepID=A0ABW5FX62_9PSEU